jgi:hypothetical protein
MRMAKSWGAWRRPGAGATWAIILRIAPTTGYVALYLWGLFFQPPTITLAKGTAPFALLPAATGAFYGYHLDKVELGRRPWRPWEVGSQTLVHVPAKWNPVRRQGHAPNVESTAFSVHIGSLSDPI